MYYLTTTAKRKNAKRHICDKNNDIEMLKSHWNNYNNKYVVEIYNGKWEKVCERGDK